MLFGAGLAISGMTDPQRVIAFLDVFGAWDPTLMFVMGGALAVFITGYRLLKKSCSLPIDDGEPVSKRLVIGSVLFGIGWGLGGFCPGPGIANLGALHHEAFAFVAAMAAGTIVAQRVFDLDGGTKT